MGINTLRILIVTLTAGVASLRAAGLPALAFAGETAPDVSHSCMADDGQRPPKYEVRAVWLTTIGGLDWPHSYAQSAASADKQKRELCLVLDSLAKAGINTVLLQTRIRATTLYPSALEPWDGCLSGFPGRSPGYDPLAFAIDECHRRGMELHAWIVTIPVGQWNGYGCRTLRKKYPKMVVRIGNEGYMNPESPLTAPYLARFCGEIARRYDIDGIHLDYIRYPETWPAKARRDGDYRRDCISAIVRSIHDEVKGVKRWVKMSCSPIGKADDLSRYWSHGWNAYSAVCQDAQGWLRRGWMDELFPMMYFDGNQFYPFAIDWQERSAGRIICPGLGIYFLSPKEKDWNLEAVGRQMRFLRGLDMGHAFFRSRFLLDDVKGIYRFTRQQMNRYPALVPPMTWENDTPPQAPARLELRRTAGRDSLRWSDGNTDLYYNVYASARYPVDISDPRLLIAVRTSATGISVPQPSPTAAMNYAVTAVDRYGNESRPVATVPAGHGDGSMHAGLLDNDGRTLRLPGYAREQDARYIVVESLQGNVLASFRSGTSVDISRLPDGMYCLRTLGGKGISHRMGFFQVKRQ